MFAQNHLNLRLVRLRANKTWNNLDDGFFFVLPKEGAGKYVSKSVSCSVAAGDVLVLNKSMNGYICAPSEEELTFCFFSLQPEHLFPLFSSHEICQLQTVTNNFKTARLYPASERLAQECHRLILDVPSELNLQHRSQLLRIAASLFSPELNRGEFPREGYVRVEEHVTQVFENLSVTDIMNMSVDQLAKAFSCSRRHLNRLFHQQYGYSVASLRMEMRLLKAASLLRDPDAKVINVAEECGFNHLGLFNTCFKRRFGASPGLWRKDSSPLEFKPSRPVLSDSNCHMRAKGLCPWSHQGKNSHKMLVKVFIEKELIHVSPSSRSIERKGRGSSGLGGAQKVKVEAVRSAPKSIARLPAEPETV